MASMWTRLVRSGYFCSSFEDVRDLAFKGLTACNYLNMQFDYLSRDSHNVGVRVSFDYQRYAKLPPVVHAAAPSQMTNA
jgi:hypothetical protein